MVKAEHREGTLMADNLPRGAPSKAQTAWSPQASVVLYAILACVVLAYAQMWNDSVLDYDDPEYLNRVVRQGLSWSGMRWAFQPHCCNWHPLTWLSHMLDCTLFPTWFGAHKLHNLALHLGSTGLFYVFLLRAGLRPPFAGGAAFVFALHPLRVASVAWISERKDCLAVFFCMLAIVCYQRYSARLSLRWYAATTAAIAAALMAKPLAVMLPAAFLALDVWPLGRAGRNGLGEARIRILEKLPWLCAACGVAVVTMIAQKECGAVSSGAPLWFQLKHMVYSYAVYLWQLLPLGRHSVLYPLAEVISFPAAGTAALAAMLAGITWLAIAGVGQRPWLTAGWLWYLFVLFPTSGIVTIGDHAHADRYTYLPHAMILAALGREAQQQYDRGTVSRGIAIAAGSVVALVLLGQTYVWASAWDDSPRVFMASLRTTGPNEPLLRFLGTYFDAVEDFVNAEKCFESAVACDPGSHEAQAQWIRSLLANGRVADARAAFERLAERDPAVALRCGERMRTWRDDGNYVIPNAGFVWGYLEEHGLGTESR
jgi:tetratricopeptide (TPR) repeat protein